MTATDALTSYRLRTVRVGVQATALALASLVAFMLIPSGVRIDRGPFVAILAIAAVGAIVVSQLPWPKLFERGWGMRAMYAWSALDILLITGILASVGQNGAPLFVLYGLTTVFAAASYRPLVQVAVWLFTVVCYVVMVLAVDGMLVLASTVARFATLGGIAFIAGFLSRELQAQNTRLEREVLDRKAAEEKLRGSEAALAEAQRIAHLGSWEWDIRANELAWSDELLRIFGVSREEFGGHYDSFMTFVHPDDRARTNDIVQKAYTEVGDFSFEHRIVRRDGTERTLFARGKVEADENGEPVRMVGTSLDLTERKKGERTERELADLAARQQQAMEINDNVVQGLTVASYSLDGGDTERARSAITGTLGAARKIVEKLLSSRYERMGPGDFVRAEPARIGAPEAENENGGQ